MEEENECLYSSSGELCEEMFNCCDCEISNEDEEGCGCGYCFSCNACDYCWLVANT